MEIVEKNGKKIVMTGEDYLKYLGNESIEEEKEIALEFAKDRLIKDFYNYQEKFYKNHTYYNKIESGGLFEYYDLLHEFILFYSGFDFKKFFLLYLGKPSKKNPKYNSKYELICEQEKELEKKGYSMKYTIKVKETLKDELIHVIKFRDSKIYDKIPLKSTKELKKGVKKRFV